MRYCSGGMEVHRLGEGTAEVAIVAAIHGDEPCGARAVERLLADAGALERPVKLIVANEAALDRGERGVDEDLNRAFPGDPDGDSHEAHLAHDLAREVQGCTVLALHSTRSFAEPFAVIDTVDEVARSLAPRLPVDVLVETDVYTDGRLIEHAHVVEVECGLQGTHAAADNAYWLSRAFLAATGAMPPPTADDPVGAGGRSAVEVFRLTGPIPKPPADRYEVYADNFQVVEAGERFAAAGDEILTADRRFYPVLLSADGYEDLFGYAADRVGTLS